MKLQGVFMIIPLLAVVANGSTIPNTDSYNVQQLEKRGDNDLDINEPADEDPMVELMAEYNAQRNSQSNVFIKHSTIMGKLERLDKQAQAKIKPQSFFDKDKINEPVGPSGSFGNPYEHQHSGVGDSGDESGKSPKSSQKSRGSRNLFTQEAKDKSKRLFNSFRAKTKPQSFFDKDRINEPVRSSGSFGNPYEHQHSGVGDSGDESGKSPKSSQKSRGSRNLFTQEAKDKSKRLFNSFRAKTKPQSFFDKDKINEPVRSSGSFGNPYEHQHSTIDWKDVLAGSSGSFQNPYKHQHSTINWKDVLAGSSGSLEEAYKHQRRIKKIKQLNQEPLKRQDEITFRDSSNKKLTETQAQATVQPSGISQEKAVNLGPILNSLKPSQDHSHDSQTELKQANDDQQRASDEIRKRYRLKSSNNP